MLGGIGSANLDIELVATVAGADDDWATDERAERFKNLTAELLQSGDVLGRDTVVNTKGLGRGGMLEFSEHKMLR